VATLFPFNQSSKIPGIVINRLKPTVLKRVEQFNKFADSLEQQLASLNKKTKCNDADILKLKNTLAQFKIAIETLNIINQQLQPLATRLQQINNIAKPVATILLAVPAVIGVPEGPKAQTIQTIADLIAGIASVISILNILLKILNNLSNIANKLLDKVERKLSEICPIENNNNLLNPDSSNNSNSSELSKQDVLINNQYPSEFYRSINTSNSDIRLRVNEINTLLDNQLDVITNLVEAPSVVLYNTGAPDSTIGKLGDYYIDTDTQTIYGPKPSQNSWT
jgi:hypothetical protein